MKRNPGCTGLLTLIVPSYPCKVLTERQFLTTMACFVSRISIGSSHRLIRPHHRILTFTDVSSLQLPPCCSGSRRDLSHYRRVGCTIRRVCHRWEVLRRESQSARRFEGGTRSGTSRRWLPDFARVWPIRWTCQRFVFAKRINEKA